MGVSSVEMVVDKVSVSSGVIVLFMLCISVVDRM